MNDAVENAGLTVQTDPLPLQKSASPWQWLGILLIATIYAGLVVKFSWLADDAFISFRYARNLVEGAGLRFNVDEQPPVEGYSNLLWVLILAGLMKLQFDPTIVSRVLSGLCGAILIWRVWSVLRCRAKLRPLAGFLAALWLATLPCFTVWATSGLETMPYALLLFCTCELLLLRGAGSSGILGGCFAVALAAMRPEGIGWVAVLLLLTAMDACFRTPSERPWRFFFTATVVASIGIAAMLGWRYWYYGHFVTNTTFMRSHADWSLRFSQGWDYFNRAAHVTIALPLILAAGLLRLWKPSHVLWTALILSFGIASFIILVGGDYMPWFRFLLPLLPFAAIVAGCVFDTLLKLRRGVVIASALALAAVTFDILPAFGIYFGNARGSQVILWNLQQSPRDPEITFRQYWTYMGKALRQHARPNDSIVMGAISAMGYYSRLKIFDSYGLTDPRVSEFPLSPNLRPGHQRYMPNSYFDDRRPTIFGASLVSLKDPPTRPLRLPDAMYLSAPLRTTQRLTRHLYPLNPNDGYPPGMSLLLIRRSDKPVDPSEYLQKLDHWPIERLDPADHWLPPEWPRAAQPVVNRDGAD